MPIVVKCPRCHRGYAAADHLAGTVVTCGCGAPFRVPGPAPGNAAPPGHPSHHTGQPPPTYPTQAAHPRPQAPAPAPAFVRPSHPVITPPKPRRERSTGLPMLLSFLLGGITVVGLAGFCIVGMFFVLLGGGEGSVSNNGVLSSGSGFIVHPDGYVLTNHHVTEGPGELYVVLPRHEKTIPAEIVASDEANDMSLLRMNLQAGSRLTTIQLAASDELGRGAPVAAFGFPLGDILGQQIKLTTGVISSPPDASTRGMLLLDCRVNPGNSGGPLCNQQGEVVGMVTAKSTNEYGLDSYGMAIPSSLLRRFLSQSCPGFGATNVPPIEQAGVGWDQVDQRVNPAIVMIVKK